MAYCVNCGIELIENAKFCQKCGHPTANNSNTSTRQQEFAGKLYKCPSCGEVLKSFETNCPACGHELRNTSSSSSVSEFAAKLEAIEKSRHRQNLDYKKMKVSRMVIDEIDQKKITLITSFVIPNTKEDLFEFLILASSNISLQRYKGLEYVSESQKAVSDAWEAKFEQAYEKAKMSFGNVADFERFKDLYDRKKLEIDKSKNEQRFAWLGTLAYVLLCICAMLGIFGIIFFIDSNKINKENERLEALVQEVYDALEAENYILARAKTATLVFSGSTTMDGDKATLRWDQTRNELLDIIDKAEYGTDYISGPREMRIGVSHEDLLDKNYLDVKTQLESKGFTNIKTEPVEDLLTGWWTSEGTVDKVSVGGYTVFTEDAVFASDIEIIIYYHAKQ